MRLYFSGHDCRYAAEQSLLMLFPGEKPEYPEGSPSGERCELRVSRGAKYTVCTALLVRSGAAFRGRAQAENPDPADEYALRGCENRLVKLAFYRAALASGLPKPEWGSLSGVRPAKLMDGYLREGLSPRAAKGRFMREYFVSGSRAQLCLDAALAAQEAARSLDERDVCLYVGIPFCPTRCAYCSFVSQSVEKSMKLMEPFLDALLLDIRATAAETRRAGLRPVALYMGGGTPTTLSAAQLDRLCAALEREFDLSALREYTVEAGRPDTITAEKLRVLRAHGVGRVSVNPQTMSDSVLEAIGRRHTAQDIVDALALVRGVRGLRGEHGPHSRACPRIRPGALPRTLDAVLSLAPENVTVHTLSLKRGSRLTLAGRPLPEAGGGARHARRGHGAPRRVRLRALLPLPPEEHGRRLRERRLDEARLGKPLQHLHHGGALQHPRHGRGRLHQARRGPGEAYKALHRPEVPPGIHKRRPTGFAAGKERIGEFYGLRALRR